MEARPRLLERLGEMRMLPSEVGQPGPLGRFKLPLGILQRRQLNWPAARSDKVWEVIDRLDGRPGPLQDIAKRLGADSFAARQSDPGEKLKMRTICRHRSWSRRRRVLRADPWLLAAQKPADVRGVANPAQHPEDREHRAFRGITQEVGIDRCERERDERGQR